jgi:hypothetical protein
LVVVVEVEVEEAAFLVLVFLGAFLAVVLFSVLVEVLFMLLVVVLVEAGAVVEF